MIWLDSARKVPCPELDIILAGGRLENPRDEVSSRTSWWPQLYVKGWVVPRLQGTQIEVIFKSVSGSTSIPLDRERPDLVAALGLNESSGCFGFEAKLPTLDIPTELSIYIKADGVEYLWWVLAFRVNPEHESLERAFRAMHGDGLDVGAGLNLDEEPQSRIGEFLSKLNETCVLVDSKDKIDGRLGLGSSHQTFLKEVFAEFSAPDAARAMCKGIENGRLGTDARWEGRRLLCSASFAVKDINFLLYRTDGLWLVLIQYCHSSIGVFIPKWNVCLSWTWWQDSIIGWKDDFLRFWIGNFQEITRYLCQAERQFAGFILGNTRPYHFFYDQVAFAHHLNASGAFEFNDRKMFLLDSASYISVKGVLNLGRDEKVVDATELNSLMFANSEFAVLLGTFRDSNFGRDARKVCFEAIRLEIEKEKRLLSKIEGRLTRLKACFPVIWVGVSAQKRVWAEQVDGIALIANSIAKVFPGMALVFDGWTSPVTSQPVDIKEAENDRCVMREIIEKIDKDIYIDTLIGAGSVEKLHFARNCDVYVSNWLQGSLHVDNIARRSGVGHFNRFWSQYSEMYCHYDCRRIEDSKIVNVDEGRPDMVSYSIQPTDVLETLLSVLNSRTVGDIRIVTAATLEEEV